MKKINTDTLKIQDVLNAIDEISKFAKDDIEKDRKTMLAIAYLVAIIGEACNKISKNLQEKHPYIPWTDIIGMRHRIIHDYGNVDIENLKQVIAYDIPILKGQMEKILAEISN